MSEWVEACGTGEIDEEDAMRFDHGEPLPSTAARTTGSLPPTVCAPIKKCISPMGW
jgi:hypothetical protein